MASSVLECDGRGKPLWKKPKASSCHTRRPQGRPEVLSLVMVPERLFSIFRLNTRCRASLNMVTLGPSLCRSQEGKPWLELVFFTSRNILDLNVHTSKTMLMVSGFTWPLLRKGGVQGTYGLRPSTGVKT